MHKVSRIAAPPTHVASLRAQSSTHFALPLAHPLPFYTLHVSPQLFQFHMHPDRHVSPTLSTIFFNYSSSRPNYNHPFFFVMEVMERTASEDVAWKMGRIMLRYRPIAPKPLAACANPCVSVDPAQAGGRAKKRKGGPRGAGRGRKSKKVEVVTLPLMPVTPERKERLQAAGSPLFCPVLSPAPARPAAVSVTVESMAEAWSVGFCGERDDELRRWLEAGDCPAFVSRIGDWVIWTNVAFRRMAVGGGFGADSPSSSSSSSYGSTSWSDGLQPLEAAVEEDLRVVLVTRGLVPGDSCQAFTCMASVRYACGRWGKVTLAVPCDAWRLKDGNLAWRLDVKAALSLSGSN